MKLKVPPRIFKFAIVGATGFLVDCGTLALVLKTTSLDAFSARSIAISTAIFSTWLLNRNVTFGSSGHSLGGEAMRYGGVGLSGSLINYMIYSAVLLAAPRAGPFAALLVASGSVAALTYLGYSRLVFQAKQMTPTLLRPAANIQSTRQSDNQ
jgi:putative flippase GtrA